MPRAESTKHMGSTQFYHSQFTNSQYLADSSASPPLSPASQQSPQSAPASASATGAGGPNAKKKHICGTCDRAFTTSGHLARHSRVHTGERNHKCPFPGCETRCSRQDNLQQHYRIHLSPGSRRSSNRSNKGSAKKGAAAAAAPATSPLSSVEPSSTTPPLPSTPALEPARIYTHHSTPPDATPPLAQATLPATANLPLANASHNRMDAGSDRSSNGGSPHLSYSSGGHHHMPPMTSQQQQQHFASGGNGTPPQQYSYRNGTTTYQEQSQSQGANPAFTYVHTTPISGAGAASGSSGGAAPSYSAYPSNAQDGYALQQQQHAQNRSPPHHSMSSRHSISHISHPQTYSQQPHHQQQQQQHHHHQSASAGPASPASSHSVSSHTSGPPTPTYPVYDDGTHPASYSNANSTMIADHTGGYAAQSQTAHIISNGYSQPAPTTNGRFGSPPPVLAPIQDERLVRRDDSRHSHSQQQQQHSASPYIHHPHPLPTEYSYHSSLGLGHGAWKGESAIRKNVGTALV